MHLRGAVAAAAGLSAAATAHVLDATGRLPFVHESVGVRTAMTPAQLVLWLAVAAGVGALAATTRVVLVGVPGAVLVSAAPELIGRGDLGAVVEPGALQGALMQVLLVLVVVAVSLVLERRLSPLRPARFATPSFASRPVVTSLPVRLLVDRTATPRGPPVCVQSMT